MKTQLIQEFIKSKKLTQEKKLYIKNIIAKGTIDKTHKIIPQINIVNLETTQWNKFLYKKEISLKISFIVIFII